MLYPPPCQAAAEQAELDFRPRATDERQHSPNPTEREALIAELTWKVLDGQASAEEQHRLGQLVDAQHRQRPLA
jgi:hypothetical protein